MIKTQICLMKTTKKIPSKKIEVYVNITRCKQPAFFTLSSTGP